MLISHEVPISLLKLSKVFNDYDYCLLHLNYQYPEYRDFYKNTTRRVLLDNSLFELGDALTNEQLAQGVLDIKPTWYVVPDCLNDVWTTIDRFEAFTKDYRDLPGKAIGVVQGKTLDDLRYCYQYMARNRFVDKIAIPFDSAAFAEYFPESTSTLVNWCYGRQAFIRELVRDGIFAKDKPHHLLGCSLAREFSCDLYKELPIESVDTSNPVVAAICNRRYEDIDGLSDKPSVKLCELIDSTISEGDPRYDTLLYNVKTFRRICNE